MFDIGLLRETIEDSLHLAKDEKQISLEDYKYALDFCHNNFKLDSSGFDFGA